MVDLNYNFECDWLVELSDNKLSDNKVSDNKLSDNNLTGELVGKFFKPITIEEIVIFMINNIIMALVIQSARKKLAKFRIIKNGFIFQNKKTSLYSFSYPRRG